MESSILRASARELRRGGHPAARPRGILLLGVPGSGKSCFARAPGDETGRPTLVLDVGALMGSLVGLTEQRVREALRSIDAMAPASSSAMRSRRRWPAARGTRGSAPASSGRC